MKSRAIIPLVIGLGIGIFAIKLFLNILKEAHGTSSVESVNVVRAKADISPTIEITESMLEVESIPKPIAPKLAFHDVKTVVGRVASQNIPMGTAVVPSVLAPEGTPPGIAVRIKDGYRAVAVKIDEYVGVAGWIKPGARVDVIALMTCRNQGKEIAISKVILQNVEVLAVGQEIGNSGDTAATVTRSVTLLVMPDEVTRLHLAATKGKLCLAMRGQTDEGTPDSSPTTDNELLAEKNTENADKSEKDAKKDSSFLSRLFSKGDKETDKKTEVPVVTQQIPIQLASTLPKQEQEWVVELMRGSGAQPELIRFDGKTKAARRVEDKDKRSMQVNTYRSVNDKTDLSQNVLNKLATQKDASEVDADNKNPVPVE